MREYLISTGRNPVADMADKFSHHLNGDPEVYENPKNILIK